PEAINEDAFGTWLIKVAMTDSSEVDKLLDAEAYAKICEG
ncbi:MAG: glycine cleavage system protein H, partial [Muribaculaceae bacterium]|nr:glycine cleavage system protein H [Muribaculaceae bacterium]